MKKGKSFYAAICMLTAFILWTAAICFVDVSAIGPQGSMVGFSTFNRSVHDFTGVHMSLYYITDWLSLIPVGVMIGFALLGLLQWIKRGQLRKVDRSILVLGGFYVVVLAVYVLFEILTLNYRPILIDGILETSYPSSTTMLVMCVMITSIMQFNARIKNIILKRCVVFAVAVYIVFMITLRFVSGVHWVTDIIGGMFLSMGLVTGYDFVVQRKTSTCG